mgnify:CR=1 FL=1
MPVWRQLFELRGMGSKKVNPIVGRLRSERSTLGVAKTTRRATGAKSRESFLTMLCGRTNWGGSVPGKVLVAEATFEVRKAEILAIVGPSGSGKSSLLRLLNRLDEPTEGNVYLDDVDYRQIAPRELRRRVESSCNGRSLFAGTVLENLRFGPRQRGEDLSLAAAEELLAGVGLSDFASRDVS